MKNQYINRIVDNGNFFGKVIDCNPNDCDNYGNMPITVMWENGEIQNTKSFWVEWLLDENKKPIYAREW